MITISLASIWRMQDIKILFRSIHPSDIFAMAPNSSFLFAVFRDEDSSTVLLPVLPLSLIDPTVTPHELSETVFLAVYVLPLVSPAVLPEKVALAVHLAPFPKPFVLFPLGPGEVTVSIYLVIFELSFV